MMAAMEAYLLDLPLEASDLEVEVPSWARMGP